MKHISIGGLAVSRIGLGAMSMSGFYNIGEGGDTESIRTIHRALDLGVTHLDTAEIYGPFLRKSIPEIASPLGWGGPSLQFHEGLFDILDRSRLRRDAGGPISSFVSPR